MLRFTVLSFPGAAGDRLAIEPAGRGPPAPPPAGVRVVGELRVLPGTRLAELSPPVLLVPGYGRLVLAELVSGRVSVPGLVWMPVGA